MDCYFHTKEGTIWRFSGDCAVRNWRKHNTHEQDYSCDSTPEEIEAVEVHFNILNASHYACSLCGRETEIVTQSLMRVALGHLERYHLAVEQPFLVISNEKNPHFTTKAHGELMIREIGA